MCLCLDGPHDVTLALELLLVLKATATCCARAAISGIELAYKYSRYVYGVCLVVLVATPGSPPPQYDASLRR